MSRLLIFNFDGTWNGRDDEYPTNIRILNRLLKVDGQVPFYFAGPGNEDENIWLMEKLGGAFGTDCRSICDAGYDTLCTAYREGDRIAVTGFSRGAAIARMFCGKVAGEGVNGDKPDIDFLGVFDTVAAFLPFGPLQQDTLFGDLHVSPGVSVARHAVAIDEDRAAFAPNLMNARDGIVEMWFRGNHADIGGGYKERGLADITLRWMVEEAGQYGLTFNPLPAPQAPGEPHREDLPLRRKKRRRGIKRDDAWTDEPGLLHPSVPPLKYTPERTKTNGPEEATPRGFRER